MQPTAVTSPRIMQSQASNHNPLNTMATKTKKTKTKAKTTKPALDKYQWLTDKFIALLEAGVNPWQREWRTTGPGCIMNFVTRQAYQGKNPYILQIDSLVRGADPYYCGRSQGFEKGWSIKKGAKAAYICYGSTYTKEDENGDDKTIPFIKWYPVFNAEDWDDSQSDHKIADLMPEALPPLNTDSRLSVVESFVKATGADIKTHGSQPCYSPAMDTITMPRWEDFSGGDSYYATLLHELTHWTGHHSRCDRDQTGRFGTVSYAQEELIAEMGAAFICNDLGVPSNIENHASYLESWLNGAKADKMYLYRSMGKAQQAVQFLQGLNA